MRTLSAMVCLLAASFAAPTPVPQQPSPAPPEAYLSWSMAQAEGVINSMIASGRVPGTRKTLNTDQAKGYKLRALWVSPEVVRARARLLQLRERLSEEQTRKLVAEAEAAGVLIVLIDLDPDEGPGVIPPDWGAYLQPSGASPDAGAAVRGTERRRLEDIRVLQNVLRRDYNYDRFWMLFPPHTDSGRPVFSVSDRAAELIVHIRGKECTVRWSIPDSVRPRLAATTP